MLKIVYTTSAEPEIRKVLFLDPLSSTESSNLRFTQTPGLVVHEFNNLMSEIAECISISG